MAYVYRRKAQLSPASSSANLLGPPGETEPVRVSQPLLQPLAACVPLAELLNLSEPCFSFPMKWIYPHLLVSGGVDEIEDMQLSLAQEPVCGD